MTIQSDFYSRFSEFDESETAPFLTPLIETYSCYYGGNYQIACEKEAILFLLAHLLTIETKKKKGSSNRSIDSKSAEGVSLSYGAYDGGTFNDFYKTTSYGQRFLMLTSKNMGGFFV